MPSLISFMLSSFTLLSLTDTYKQCTATVVYRTGCCPRPVGMPDTVKRTSHFIEQYGFGAEIHEIYTEDGYMVKAHRILVDPRNDSLAGEEKPPIILQHGIAASSATWMLSKEKSFPLLLARAGFDVWLLDTRENSYTRKHIYLPSTDPNFWQFSFHEMAVYDLPAAVDHILQTTGQEKTFYVGHSRGTTMAFILLSLKPEYNSKFHLLSMFAPVAYVRHIGNPFIRILFKRPLAYNLESIVNGLGASIVPGSSDSMVQFREIICNRTRTTCMDLVFSFGGFDYELLDKSMVPVYLSHYPEGGAIRDFMHYLQIGTSDKFRQFDHGEDINIKLYGSPVPPLYDLSKITAPIALHYGENDLVVRPPDFNHLVEQLGSVVAKVRVPFKKFSHTDFQWALNADVLVYNNAIDLMKQFVPL